MNAWLVDCEAPSSLFHWHTPEEIARDYSLPTALRAFQDKIGGA